MLYSSINTRLVHQLRARYTNPSMTRQSTSLPEEELQELIVQAQAGDAGAFEAIYNEFFPAIYRYTAFRAREEIAEDLVADIFVKAWEKLHHYKRHRGVPFAAWLFRIARYTVIDSYRQHEELSEVPEELADPDSMNRADASFQTKEVLKIVRKALSLLPKRYREILMLTYIAELSHEEVARVLRLTEGAVRVLKFRALKKLSALLPPEMHDSSF